MFINYEKLVFSSACYLIFAETVELIDSIKSLPGLGFGFDFKLEFKVGLLIVGGPGCRCKVEQPFGCLDLKGFKVKVEITRFAAGFVVARMPVEGFCQLCWSCSFKMTKYCPESYHYQ